MARSGTIRTARLVIEPFSKKHLTKEYVSWLNNPKVARFSEQRFRKHTLLSCRDYWHSYQKTPHYFWAITVADSPLGHIGNINAYVDKQNKVADIGILIGKTSAWGKGYGKEAWLGICNYLFKKAKMRKITAGTLAENKTMLAVMQRSGMKVEGRRIRQNLWNGKEVDIIYTAIFKEDFNEGKILSSKKR
jgi:RimJ/RimL family protein N-acetyltransferase